MSQCFEKMIFSEVSFRAIVDGKVIVRKFDLKRDLLSSQSAFMLVVLMKLLLSVDIQVPSNSSQNR